MANTLAKVATLAMGFGLTGSLAQTETTYRGYEMPPYQVEGQVGAAELRAYAPHVVALVTVRGDQSGALGRGFQVLARYIFGANLPREAVAMTTPVTQTPGTEIAMTAPVGQAGEGDLWTVSFTMPSQYTLATLPAPQDPAIRFEETVAQRQIVLTFSGRATDAALAERTAEVRALAEGAGLRLAGGPVYYFYDDPFTLPWNRRNEVAFRLE